MNFPFFIAKRYFLTSKKRNFVHIISWISLLGIAVGSAAFFIILRLFQIGDGMDIPKVLTTKPKNMANINGFLKTKLKILLNTFVKLLILLLLWHNSIERMPMK